MITLDSHSGWLVPRNPGLNASIPLGLGNKIESGTGIANSLVTRSFLVNRFCIARLITPGKNILGGPGILVSAVPWLSKVFTTGIRDGLVFALSYGVILATKRSMQFRDTNNLALRRFLPVRPGKPFYFHKHSISSLFENGEVDSVTSSKCPFLRRLPQVLTA